MAYPNAHWPGFAFITPVFYPYYDLPRVSPIFISPELPPQTEQPPARNPAPFPPPNAQRVAPAVFHAAAPQPALFLPAFPALLCRFCSTSRCMPLSRKVFGEQGSTVVGALSKEELSQPATHPPVKHITIICDSIPNWPIEVKPAQKERKRLFPVERSSHDALVTLEDVLIAMHKHMQQPVTQVEWAELSEADVEKVSRVYTRRCRTFPREGPGAFKEHIGVRRVDYLGDNYMFRGLVRHKAGQEGFEKLKLLVGPAR
ncbi:uncharacterized protein LAESUDRAFT_750511 [Laetiporus sulphureus 93-53]|uniref:DUF6699 domain-containing protein n=1 Tax=Laetiporus sulphureus 93-53 TaxID=1314785 RepID=A0A165DT93_9APHY|nr:uncharacterized protein LAESUDRAFT_750511 [Laetiporus sulphureus 93-53]KZT05583.1 hypothetical protein LAESUDRAFT_750511 [Laetiporus sulphureus 93-53]